MRWVYVALGVVVGVGCLVVMAVSVAGSLWSRQSMLVRRELLDGRRAPEPVDSGGTPLPVVRYLAWAIPARSDLVTAARLEQEGDFQMGEGAEGWRPFTATHMVRSYPPAFQWDARIGMAPLVTVRVRDGYRDGQGGMTAKVGGLFTVVDAVPTPELARAALQRFLAEAAWVPTRLLPGNGVKWTAVDDSTATVTLTDRELSVSATMSFDSEGRLVATFIPDRGREVDGAYVPTPWHGRFWAYDRVEGGFMVPREGEVSWIIEGDTVPYWRGRMTSVKYWGSQ